MLMIADPRGGIHRHKQNILPERLLLCEYATICSTIDRTRDDLAELLAEREHLADRLRGQPERRASA